ncbi:RNA polymerase sigma factor [Altericroceibacterium endophyticum]|uniref:Sigma-70 family RNA polymerase sigma factor n=1 Tax=Altericroceibacterium endophyticum TaxID=1808508 RepID=A0A6I4T2T6_9SPHN|nr:RNA polymerase sigma factor [Altericroceibacterium endophyticum]MXO64310.1 sigma-70 family RNA polymerase sigma factor [Altericroceibacterium endophyticum]
MAIDESAYRLFRGDVYRLAYRKLGDHSASEDIVHDSFLRFAQYRKEAVGNVGGMLHRIASNLIIDRVRNAKRRAEDALPQDGMEIAGDEPSQEQALIDRERMDQASRILDQMPPMRREVFIMRRLHGMSAKEVGAAMAISPAAVDAHVARAVLALHRGFSASEEHSISQ